MVARASNNGNSRGWPAIVAFSMVALSQGAFGYHAEADGTPRGAKRTPTGLVQVRGIDSTSDKHVSLINIRLSGPPAFATVEIDNHKNFLQLRLPRTSALRVGEMVPLEGGFLSSGTVFQTSPTESVARLYLNDPSKLVANATTAEVMGDRVLVTLDHNKLQSQQRTGLATPTEDGEPKPTAEDIIKKVGGDGSHVAAPEPAAIIKDEAATSNALGAGAPTSLLAGTQVVDLSGKLYGVAAFSALMLMGLLAAFVFRKQIRQRSSQSESGETFSMKTLATFPIMSKQRLALIEVCGERILLAVSADQVNYITTLGHAPMRSAAAIPASTERPTSSLSPAAAQLAKMMRLKGAQLRQETVDLAPQQSANQQKHREEGEGLDDAFPSDVNPFPAKQASQQEAAQVRGKKAGGLSIKADQKGAEERAGSRINIAVTDDGITSVGTSGAVNDVTKMIRERLRKLSRA